MEKGVEAVERRGVKAVARRGVGVPVLRAGGRERWWVGVGLRVGVLVWVFGRKSLRKSLCPTGLCQGEAEREIEAKRETEAERETEAKRETEAEMADWMGIEMRTEARGQALSRLQAEAERQYLIDADGRPRILLALDLPLQGPRGVRLAATTSLGHRGDG